ncbi:MAG: hypothetical protein K8S98_17200 [Planctomycetes bacterium]|nr:hypothetical protein [Planctomycetota bacterium]
MIATLLLLCAQSSDATATWLAERKSVEVGEPIELVLEVEHPLESTARVADEKLGLDDSWVVLSKDEPRSRPVDGRPDRARTTLRATVVSLEPGERDLAPLKVEIAAHGDSVSIFSSAPHVAVKSVLGDAEHERPPKGFRSAPDFGPQREAWPWLVGLALLVAFGAAFVVARALRRRARPAPVAASALTRLDELERSDLERTDAAREAHFALTRIVRGEVDRRAGVERSGLADDEWFERALADAGLAAKIGPERERLEALLAACAEVKYGGAAATHWAARERIGGAREILKRLEAPVEATK